jgi:hypothetical protein
MTGWRRFNGKESAWRRALEGVKKSGLSQAPAKNSLISKNLAEARLTVPVFFHAFLPPTFTPSP